MKNPYISIIITAYNRKEFLTDAIESALMQSLNKEYYEIIVIKNFKDNQIDEFIVTNNIKSIIMEGTIGEYLYTGIKEAKGDIISFLDDDDYYDTTRLEIVMNVFQKNLDVVYYHNNQVFINEKNEYINKNKIVVKGKIDSSRVILDWFKIDYLLLNSSSICIRKDFYMRYLSILRGLKAHPDDFMLFCAVNELEKIFIDPNFLTFYRLHNSTSNIKIDSRSKSELSKYRLQKASLFSKYTEATDYIMKNLGNKSLRKILYFRFMKEKILLDFYERNEFKSENVSEYFQLITFMIKHRKHLGNSILFVLFVFKYLYYALFHFSDRTPFMLKIQKFLGLVPV